VPDVTSTVAFPEDRLVPILGQQGTSYSPRVTVRRGDCPKWIAQAIFNGRKIPAPNTPEGCHKGYRNSCYWAMLPQDNFSVCAHDRMPYCPVSKKQIDEYLAAREKKAIAGASAGVEEGGDDGLLRDGQGY